MNMKMNNEMQEKAPPGLMLDGTDIKVFAEKNLNEIQVYFWPKRYRPSESVVKTCLNGLVFNGNCTGYNVDRLVNGEIRVYLNPTYHNVADARRDVSKLIKVLRSFRLSLKEEE